MARCGGERSLQGLVFFMRACGRIIDVGARGSCKFGSGLRQYEL
jgi:hypothetical protein